VNEDRRNRVAKNEALIRSLNERVKEIAEPFLEVGGTTESERVAFVCECGREGCYETIDLLVAEYERARAQPTRFVVVPGHEVPEVERVVSREERFALVEKHAEESDIATATDPRSERP
jgi:hypothetical protein